MKTFFKIIIIGLLVVVAGLITVTTYQFNTYTPQAITQEVNPADLKYFQESYVDCRSQFLDQANKIKADYAGVQITALKVESQVDSDLTIDYCYIPAQKSYERLLILTSAVHGVEGYVGSAIQQMFLNELVKEIDMDDMGVLIIHGINPYGFKYKRRVSENNVDLNRNCSTDPALYSSVNEGYKALNIFLNQKTKVNLTRFDNIFFQVTAIQKIIKYGMSSLRQAVLQGQYQFEKGVYFGGKALEPPVLAVTPLIQKIAQPYKMVFDIDLHTGYGANGTLHLFPDPLKDPEKKAKIENIFSGTRIDWGDTDDFYTVTGSFTSYVGQIIPEKYYMTMTFEFGTLDTQSKMGIIKALHNVMIENQGVQNGYQTEKDETGVKSRYVEGYYPSSEAWRSKAINDARELLKQAMGKYSDTK